MENFKELAQKIGIESDDLAKIESGEITLDDYAEQFHSKYAETVKTRISKDIEDRVLSDSFGKAYSRTEKLFLDEFGLAEDIFKDVAKNERTKFMASYIKEQHKKEIESFKNLDVKTKQLSEQLELANRTLKQKDSEIEERINQIKSEYTAKETTQVFNSTLSKQIANVTNPTYDAEIMESIVKMRINSMGLSYEVENGKVWLLKDGARVAHPERKTENMDLKTFFESVATEKNFTKTSNGTPDKKVVELTDDVKSKLPKKFLESQNNR
jgi:hypothetical protein